MGNLPRYSAGVSPYDGGMLDSDLEKRINQRLVTLGLTARQASLIASGGRNPEVIRNIRRGKSRSPRGDTISSLARALECSVEWLLSGEGSPDAAPTMRQPAPRTWGRRIEARRAQLGLTRAELARDARVSYDALAKWVKDGVAQPRAAALKSLAEALDVTEQWILYGDDDRDSEPEIKETPTFRVGGTLEPLTTRGAPPPTGADLPIYGTEEIEGPGVALSTEAIEYSALGGPLVGVKGAYGLYVIGNDMAPAYCHGDLVLIHPNKPAQAGDDVLVVQNDSAAVLGCMTMTAPKNVVLTRYASDEAITIQRNEIARIQLVVGCYRRA